MLIFEVRLLLVMTFSGLGILNLVVGILCQSAMGITKGLEAQDRQKQMRQLKMALKDVRDGFEAKAQKGIL